MNPRDFDGFLLMDSGSLLRAVKEKITTGISAVTFSPDDDCTRGQTVTFLYRSQAKK